MTSIYPFMSAEALMIELGVFMDAIYTTQAEANATKTGVVRPEHGGKGTALVTIGNANQTRFFRVVEGGTISKVRIYVGVSSGNIAVAAYSNTGTGLDAVPGTLLATSGSVVCPAAAAVADVPLGSSVTLAAGDWLALAADNTTATFSGISGSGDLTLSAAQSGSHSVFPPSATPTFTAGNNRLINLIGVP